MLILTWYDSFVVLYQNDCFVFQLANSALNDRSHCGRPNFLFSHLNQLEVVKSIRLN